MGRHRKPTRRGRFTLAVVAVFALIPVILTACSASSAPTQPAPPPPPSSWHDTGVQWSQWACFGHLLLIKSGGYHENIVTPAVSDPDHLCGLK